MKILEIIKNSSEIKKIFENYGLEFSDDVLNKNLSTLYDYLVSIEKNNSKIYTNDLVYLNNQFYLQTKYSDKFLNENPYYKIQKNIVYENVNLSNFNGSLKQIEQDNLKSDDLELKTSVRNLLKLISKILSKNNESKGIYIQGEPGVGKTYILKAIAKKMAEKDKTVVITTLENLLQITRDSYSNPENKKESLNFRTCQKVDVLLLDDLGVERVNKWSRDEILFPIINHRLEHKKITFFASNLSFEDLFKKYSNIQDGTSKSEEKIASNRIVDRIRGLTYGSIEIKGKSRR